MMLSFLDGTRCLGRDARSILADDDAARDAAYMLLKSRKAVYFQQCVLHLGERY